MVLLFQRNGNHRRILKFCKGPVQRIGRNGHRQWMGLVQKTAGENGQNVVGTVRGDHLVRRDPVEGRNLLPERLGHRIRVQTETIQYLICHHLFQTGRRRIRILVGVQFDDLLPFRLFAGNIAGHFGNDRTDIRDVHFRKSFLMVALLPCASRPSCDAKHSIAGISLHSASSVYSRILLRRMKSIVERPWKNFAVPAVGRT